MARSARELRTPVHMTEALTCTRNTTAHNPGELVVNRVWGPVGRVAQSESGVERQVQQRPAPDAPDVAVTEDWNEFVGWCEEVSGFLEGCRVSVQAVPCGGCGKDTRWARGRARCSGCQPPARLQNEKPLQSPSRAPQEGKRKVERPVEQDKEDDDWGSWQAPASSSQPL